MLNQELRNKVDRLWDSFWSGGISNPLTVIEQISYLLFIKGLDDREIREEKKANRTGKHHKSIFPSNDCRWSIFKHYPAQKMYDIVLKEVFPFIKEYKQDESLFAQHMKDAVFLVQKPSLLFEAVQLIDNIDMDDRDTKGDLYEYLLSKLTTAGVNGQFRTPRHIIKMMVELVDPKIGDKICDPACGTAGFLVAASEYILSKYTSPERVFKDENGILHDKIGDKLTPNEWEQFRKEIFYGADFDASMLRISAMNMMLHGIEEPNIQYADSLSSSYEVEGDYDIVLANPPFKGSLDEGDINQQLKHFLGIKTHKNKEAEKKKGSKHKTELLFLALFIRILDVGGRCCCIVPDGVLFGSSKVHKLFRTKLINENQLEAVISMPSGVFRPYAGVSTAILLFTKGGRTDRVWFYDMQADGFSLDDKRNPIDDNDIPDIVDCWKKCQIEINSEPSKNDKWFWIDKRELELNNYDLSLNKYKEVECIEEKMEEPHVIVAQLEALENEITEDLIKLKDMIGL